MLFVISLKKSYGGRSSIDKPSLFENVSLVPAAPFMFSGKSFRGRTNGMTIGSLMPFRLWGMYW